MPFKSRGYSFNFKARSATIVIDIIGVVFIGVATGLQPHFNTDGFGGAADGMQLAPLVFSLLWTTISLGISLAGKRYHPGVDVGIDLFAVLLACGMVWLIIWWTSIIGSYDGNCYGDDCTHTKASALKASEIIGILAISVSTLIHLIICCRACSAIHKLRIKGKRDRDSVHELNGIEAVKG